MINYVAGIGNRYFIANFKILGGGKVLKYLSGFPQDLNTIISFFPLVFNLDEIDLWEDKIFIKDILHDLSFIIDKKNYGLYLRHGIRKISKSDYDIILRNVL